MVAPQQALVQGAPVERDRNSDQQHGHNLDPEIREEFRQRSFLRLGIMPLDGHGGTAV